MIIIKEFETRELAEAALTAITDSLKIDGWLTVADVGEMFHNEKLTNPDAAGEDPFAYGWIFATDFMIHEGVPDHVDELPVALVAKSPIKIKSDHTKPSKPDKPNKKKVQRMIRIFGNRDYGALEASVNAFLASNEVSRVFRIEYCSNEESGSSGHKFTRYSCMVDYNGYSEVK